MSVVFLTPLAGRLFVQGDRLARLSRSLKLLAEAWAFVWRQNLALSAVKRSKFLMKRRKNISSLKTTPSDRLRGHGLRPTQQRLALSALLFDGADRHVTAEALHSQALGKGHDLSLATVYNALHQFTQAGLLRQVIVNGEKTYFDTNTTSHHHFFHEGDGRLIDIPGDAVRVEGLPSPPRGAAIARVDVIVRLKDR
jgi:Fur family iron response transcriptional regulator